MNKWSVEIREIIIVTIALMPILVIGNYFQIPPEPLGVLLAVVALIVSFPLELHIRGYINSPLLSKLIPITRDMN